LRKAAAHRRFGVALSAVLLLASASAAPASAQQVFKYQDANGVWVFTDRRPEPGQPFEQTEIRRSFQTPEVRLLQRRVGASIAVVAQNTYFSPVQLAFRLTALENVAADTPRSGIVTIPARSEQELLVVGRSNPAAEMSLAYEFQYLPGSPDAEHRPDRPYRLPYALASSFPVSQAYPDTTTHDDDASRHAIDFVMPIGTGVYAARAGTVIEVASDFFEAGLDFAEHGPRANIVRVLHEDGTMALYAHLNWNSIRVVPGQRVARGEYFADSGNTGFSTGPHLHFVVQRNRGGAIESVPVEFAGPGGTAIAVTSGNRYTAY
jgi:murein DD-endopeptidase MepM/ murein hydrolase activator NlpD